MIQFLALLGVWVSLYALWIERRKLSDIFYEAYCDFSKQASCSAVLTGKYSRMLSLMGLVEADGPLDVPNAVIGVFFYCLMAAYRYLPNSTTTRTVYFVASLAALAASMVLANILAFVLHDFCVVCVSSYLINFLIAVVMFDSYITDDNHKPQVGVKRQLDSRFGKKKKAMLTDGRRSTTAD